MTLQSGKAHCQEIGDTIHTNNMHYKQIHNSKNTYTNNQ